LPKLLLVIVLLLPYFPLGMLLDPASMLFLTLPFIWPIIQASGTNPIWFGILVVKVVEISMITPPVGMTVYVVHGLVPEVPLGDIFRGTVIFLVMEFISLAILLLVPELALVLVNMMR
jgi:TRAP-type C4-dicarboxylate transport system permease large subunit